MKQSNNENLYTPEVWGGIEYTINRVGNEFYDQLDCCRFYDNPNYLDKVLELGINTLRFPVLWEKHQPQQNGPIDFQWATTQLDKIRSYGVTPIIGLIHHGSGPSYTDLLSDNFAELFAAYAAEVAKQFPWAVYYTPVNEPLTTARFSGLYGHWYPHKTNDVSFVKMLLNQLKATVLAMQEIRKINPVAKLVQTEDLGKTYSTPLLAYQATFENNRRWLTYDILCGKLDPQHVLWNYFIRLGIEEEQLYFFIKNACPPDIMGVNYYVTSERFIDENIHDYPAVATGGNGLHQYADVEAVRVIMQEPAGLKVLLKEMWERYKLPIAITEAHINCTREEQLRWFKDIYSVAGKLKEEGVAIIAVTAWALLGAYGWNKLLTSKCFDYEIGAYDVSAGYARLTALGELIRTMKKPAKQYIIKEVTAQNGWWKLKDRYFKRTLAEEIMFPSFQKPLLIIGKKGTLAKAFARIAKCRNLYFITAGSDEVDITKMESVEKLILTYEPWGVINAAGYVDVDKAEKDNHNCLLLNSFGVKNLSVVCNRYGIKLMTFSSDLVFDGVSKKPYKETDQPKALNVYGNSKILAETFIENYHPGSLVIRTSAFFGPWDEYNFLACMQQQLLQGKAFSAMQDIAVSPTYVPHLVDAALDLLIDDAKGIWHLANKGNITWYEFARQVALNAGWDTSLIIPVSSAKTIAKRPQQSVLTSERYGLMPALEDGMTAYLNSKQVTVN